jgi:hypothetical protein
VGVDDEGGRDAGTDLETVDVLGVAPEELRERGGEGRNLRAG